MDVGGNWNGAKEDTGRRTRMSTYPVRIHASTVADIGQENDEARELTRDALPMWTTAGMITAGPVGRDRRTRAERGLVSWLAIAPQGLDDHEGERECLPCVHHASFHLHTVQLCHPHNLSTAREQPRYSGPGKPRCALRNRTWFPVRVCEFVNKPGGRAPRPRPERSQTRAPDPPRQRAV